MQQKSNEEGQVPHRGKPSGERKAGVGKPVRHSGACRQVREEEIPAAMLFQREGERGKLLQKLPRGEREVGE